MQGLGANMVHWPNLFTDDLLRRGYYIIRSRTLHTHLLINVLIDVYINVKVNLQKGLNTIANRH
jgi:hypothetical protein